MGVETPRKGEGGARILLKVIKGDPLEHNRLSLAGRPCVGRSLLDTKEEQIFGAVCEVVAHIPGFLLTKTKNWGGEKNSFLDEREGGIPEHGRV